MPRPWIDWPARFSNGGIFDPQESTPASINLTRAEPPAGNPEAAPDAHIFELQAWEGLEGEEPSGGGGGAGGSARACACDLDDCPHNQEMPSGQRIEFDSALLHQMMAGFNPKLISPRKERRQRDTPGKRSLARTAFTRGRYIRAWHAGPSSRDIALDATIRTAALHQHARDRTSSALRVEPSDLHAKVRQRKVGNLVLFVVDCSASMGTQRRIIATQGAILSLLVDAYQRRDRVGLVTFREQSATVNLRPTASIELAKGAFQSLAIGGTTPLSKGLLTAYELIQRERQRERGLLPVLILISDGNANVSMSELSPMKEATLVGEMIRAKQIRTIVLGAGGEGWHMADGTLFAPAQELAAAMQGEFFPMEDVTVAGILNILHRQRVLIP